MQLHEAHELIEVYSASEATRRIQDGWTLLNTVGTDTRVVYVLGKRAPGPERETVSPASVIGVSTPRRR